MPDIPKTLPAPRAAVAWVAATLLQEPRCAAARIRQPQPDADSDAAAGRTDQLSQVHAETTKGRHFTVTVITDDPDHDATDAWSFPGSFGDALANPDPRRWVALTVGRSRPTGMFLAPEHALRRIVMARHLEAARHGVWTPIAHDTTSLHLALDLAPIRGLLVNLSDVFGAVESDTYRHGDVPH
ncbi:hypothetical protein [Actinotalea solisilvae]|uniref:hypothetical protein n=1 Tax=Actinotalea solisilvae TaxID=2072922 RepID=UPI0018F1CB71|nr:hypothetical protein [Actinotalea solisilvae]